MKTKLAALFLLASSSMFAGWRVGFGVGVGPVYVPPPRVYVTPRAYVAPPPYVYGAPYVYSTPYPYVREYVTPAPYVRGYWGSGYDRHRWRDHDRDRWRRDWHHDRDHDRWRHDRR